LKIWLKLSAMRRFVIDGVLTFLRFQTHANPSGIEAWRDGSVYCGVSLPVIWSDRWSYRHLVVAQNFVRDLLPIFEQSINNDDDRSKTIALWSRTEEEWEMKWQFPEQWVQMHFQFEWERIPGTRPPCDPIAWSCHRRDIMDFLNMKSCDPSANESIR
jgi:hypothetical protein